MILTSYYHIRCPACGGSFFVDGGDPQDITTPDIESVGCPWCEHAFYLGDEDEECDGCCDRGVKELRAESPDLKVQKRMKAFAIADKHFRRKKVTYIWQERGRFSFVSLPANTKKEIERIGIYIDQWGEIVPTAKAKKIINNKCICPKGKESTHCPIHAVCNCCHGAQCPQHDEPEKIEEKRRSYSEEE
jgi:hypothetical protein